VPDAFHVTRLGVDVVDQVRRRVQQDTLGHRGRKHDPLDRIRNVLRAGGDRLTSLVVGPDHHWPDPGRRRRPPHPRLAVLPAAALDLPPARPAKRPRPGRGAPGLAAVLPRPRGRPPRTDPAPLEDPVPGQFHHRPGQQGRRRGPQRHHRDPPPHRPRPTQPLELAITDDPGRRRTHPPESPLNRETVPHASRAAAECASSRRSFPA
jgi:transposase